DALSLQGDYARASEVLAEARKLFATLGDGLGTARTLASLGREAFRTARYEDAKSFFGEALVLGGKLDNHIVIGCSLAGYAALVGTRGQLHLAALLYGCASDLTLSESTTLERCAMTLNLDEVRAALDATDPQAWQAAWEEGRAMPWEEAAPQAQSSI